ncbi:MAG TPA: PilZ domain-containing protein [Croceibacterium sp.]|nr:PilZ domain-containing protein [Croceibacterium sp.]
MPIDTELMIGRRAHARVACEFGVDVKHSAGDWQRALLRDISLTGFMLVVPDGMLPCESLWLRLPEIGPVPARLRWRKGAVVGCEFLYALERTALAKLERRVARTL